MNVFNEDCFLPYSGMITKHFSPHWIESVTSGFFTSLLSELSLSPADKLEVISLEVRFILQDYIPSDSLIQQHPTEHGEWFRGVGQFSCDKVNTDCVPCLQGQDNVEDSQSTRYVFDLCHGLFQAFRLISSWIYPGNTYVGLWQHSLDLHVLMASKDAAKEVLSFHWSCELTWRMDAKNKEDLLTMCKQIMHWQFNIDQLY